MAALTPTVVASGDAHYNRMQDQSGNSALSMGGGAVRSNNFLIDGFPTTDLQNRSSVNPSMEALQDTRVQIRTYDAEMGRTGGGVMNMAARAGSNRFEGSAYTVFRPQKLQEQLLLPRRRQRIDQQAERHAQPEGRGRLPHPGPISGPEPSSVFFSVMSAP